MADEITLKAPKLEQDVNIVIDGMDKLREFARILDRMARGDDLSKYWKSQKALVEDLTRACGDFNRANSDINAKSLINTANALKAVAGSDLSPLFKDFSSVEDAIARASAQVGRFVGEILPQDFKAAFDSFEMLKAAGLDMEDTFRRFTTGADVEQLQNSVRELSTQLGWAKRAAADAKAELALFKEGDGVREMNEELNKTRDLLDDVTTRMQREFSAFLSANDIAETDQWGWGRFDSYFEQIRNGSLTAKEAIAKFRAEYSELFSGAGEARIPGEQLKQFTEMLETACRTVEELSGYIRTLDASSLQGVARSLGENANLTERQREAMTGLAQDAGGIENVSRILVELVRSSGAAEEGMDAVHSSLAGIVNALREMSGMDVENLTALGTVFRSLGLLNEITIDHTQLANLATALQSISAIANLGNVGVLSAVDLSPFNELHVSKASLANLAAYLPQIAEVDTGKLARLSRIDLTNFNNIKVSKSSVENLLALANVAETLQSIQNRLGDKLGGGSGGSRSGGGGGSGGSGGGGKTPPLAGDNELAAANRRLVELREKSAAWSGTLTDAARSAVSDLNGVIERLAALRDEVESGKLSLNEFKERFAKIGAEASSAEEIVKRFGEESRSATSASPSLSAIEMQLEAINRLKSTMGNGIFNAWKSADTGGDAEERRQVEELTGLYKILGETVKDANRNKSQISPKQFETIQQECEGLWRQIELLREAQKEREKAASAARRASGASPADNEYVAQAKLMAEAQRELDNAYRRATSGKGALGDQTQLDELRRQYDALIVKQAGFEKAERDVRAALIGETRELAENFRAKLQNAEATGKESEQISERARRLRLVTQLEREANAELQRSGAARFGKSSEQYSALKGVISDLADLRQKVDNAGVSTKEFNAQYQNLNNTLRASVNVIAANGERAKTLTERIAGLADKFAVWFGITRIIMAAVRTHRQMISTTVELDDALTSLEVVTHANAAAMRSYGVEITQTAKEISASVKDLVDSTTVYARLGYTLDESSKLAKYTSMLQNVGDIDAEAAQNAITAVVKAYDVGVGQIEQIMDKMVKVGNNFPISVSQLAEGMNNAGSALHSAGNTFEQSLALLAAANTTVQNISKASTGLRTIAARIRNTKTELDEMGEAMTEADYENLVKALTNARVALTNANGSFRSTYDIMKDIAGVWHTLSSDVQAALAETLSGTRQQNIFYSLIEQFGEAEGAMKSMRDSAGELESAYAIYMDSISAHINKFKAAFQELSQAVMDSEMLKDAVDLGAGFLSLANGITKVINAAGGLETVLVEIGGLVLFSKLPQIEKSLKAFSASGGLTTAVGGFFKTLGAAPGLMKEAAAGAGSFVDVLGAAVPTLTGFQVALLGVLVVLPLLVAGFKAVKKAWDEAHPSLEKLKEDFDAVQSEADELSEKLKTNEERVAALKKAAKDGKLSFVEQDELDRLEAENRLLKAQADAYETLAQSKKQLVADKARSDAEAFLIDDGTRDISGAGSLGNYFEKTYTGAGGLKDAINEYAEAQRRYNDAIAKEGAESREAARAKGDEVKNLERIVALQEQIVGLRRDLANDPEANAATIRELDALLDKIDLAVNGTEALRRIVSRFFDGGAVKPTVEKLRELRSHLTALGYDNAANLSLAEVRDILNDIGEAAGEAADEIIKVAEGLTTLAGIEKGIGSLTTALNEFQNSGFVSAQTMESLREAFGKNDSWEAFKKTLSDTTSTSEEAREAANRLAEEWLVSGGTLKEALASVTEENRDSTVAFLENMGVTNAAALVDETLAANAIEARYAIVDLTTATGDETIARLRATGATEAQVAALERLRRKQVVAKIAAADFVHANSATIASLLNIANAAGIAGSRIDILAQMQSVAASASDADKASGRYAAYMANAKKRLLDGFSEEVSVELPEVEVPQPNENKSGGGSSGAAKKEVEEYIAEVDRFREAIRRLNEARADRGSIEHDISRAKSLDQELALQNRLIDAYRTEQEALHNLNEERDAALHEEVGKLTELGFDVEYDDESNKLWIVNLEHINELEGSTTEATNEMRKEAEKLISTLNEWNEANGENSESWIALQESIEDAGARIVEIFKEMVEEASEAVDSIQSVWDTLHKAADEAAASGGFISVDTFQEIIALGPQYMQFLQDENGALVITHDRLRDIIAAKTEELALEQALSYIERLRLAMRENSVEDLDELLYATQEASGATWDLVYANLALLGLDDKQYAAAKHNIDAMRALAESAIESIGKPVGAFKDELQEMKSGIDDLLKYVMAMLKQRVQDQIDALGEAKKRYADIIALKKESIKASKQETDYQKKVAEQVKEIARLQARIDALSLDTSRDAQAQRQKLLEELAEKQDSLADDQAEHAISATEKALDEQQEAYEKEKDAEIKTLEESISSTEKLYRMAVDYIHENWSTLRDELIQWNYDVGTNFQYEIEQAWENALKAAQRYGDYVTALAHIDGDIEAASGSGHNDVVAPSGSSTHNSGTANLTPGAHKPTVWLVREDGSAPEGCKQNDLVVTAGGVWRVTGVHGDGKYDSERASEQWYNLSRDDVIERYQNLKKKIETYHTGGIAGGGTLREDELMAKLQKGEAVVSNRAKGFLLDTIELMSMLRKKLDVSSMQRIKSFDVKDVQRSLYSATAPTPSINFGDVIVYGADEKSVDEIRKIKREQANEVLSYLGLRK